MDWVDFIHILFWGYVVVMALLIIWLLVLLILETRDFVKQKRLEKKIKGEE